MHGFPEQQLENMEKLDACKLLVLSRIVYWLTVILCGRYQTHIKNTHSHVHAYLYINIYN